MLNEIEEQFEEFITAMYGTEAISEAQEKDIEKSFYAGMVVAHSMMMSLSLDEKTALMQLDRLTTLLLKKAEELRKC